jgi:hypothetical protein
MQAHPGDDIYSALTLLFWIGVRGEGKRAHAGVLHKMPVAGQTQGALSATIDSTVSVYNDLQRKSSKAACPASLADAPHITISQSTGYMMYVAPAPTADCFRCLATSCRPLRICCSG